MPDHSNYPCKLQRKHEEHFTITVYESVKTKVHFVGLQWDKLRTNGIKCQIANVTINSLEFTEH